ncbi:hypothetical protein MTBBW1_1060008 [Desulfamplus magnetovallimortis]|uniref:Uncharacterized protein n=1 Tax=Desulfamplus magnetovallimortis TaxID=1246637 RepID=A0A1W1H5D0_9BACT|nr:hypothetical protein MTBBW1_1060008 [Desulfamplus magnetovallimortis]
MKVVLKTSCYRDFPINPHDFEGITKMHESHDISLCCGDFLIQMMPDSLAQKTQKARTKKL